MGTIYSVACTECKVTRDLDKFYEAGFLEENTRESMLELADRWMSGTHFQSALLASFMYEHAGHKCVFFWENHECEDLYDPFPGGNGYTEDFDYWCVAPHKEPKG